MGVPVYPVLLACFLSIPSDFFSRQGRCLDVGHTEPLDCEYTEHGTDWTKREVGLLQRIAEEERTRLIAVRSAEREARGEQSEVTASPSLALCRTARNKSQYNEEQRDEAAKAGGIRISRSRN